MHAAPSDFDRRHVGRIMGGYGDWFTARVLRLCLQADLANLARLRLAFPETVALYEAWRDSPDGTVGAELDG